MLAAGLLMRLFSAPAEAAEQRFDCVMDAADMVSVGGPVVGLLDDVLVDRGDIMRQIGRAHV